MEKMFPLRHRVSSRLESWKSVIAQERMLINTPPTDSPSSDAWLDNPPPASENGHDLEKKELM